MSRSFKYDDTQLRKLYGQLSEEQRGKALKGAMRREARKFRSKVAHTLATTPGGRRGRPLDIDEGDAEEHIRARVFKKALGFQVSIYARKGRKWGYHHNRHGDDKPILMWAEGGTDQRRTKSNAGKHRRTWTWRLRRGHNTGRMQAYRFMSITRDREKDNVSASLQDEFRKYVTTTAKRYGCTV